MQMSLKQRSIYPFKYATRNQRPSILLFFQRRENRWRTKKRRSLMRCFSATSFKERPFALARRRSVANRNRIHRECAFKPKVLWYIWVVCSLGQGCVRCRKVGKWRKIGEAEGRGNRGKEMVAGSCHYANLRPEYNRREEFYAFCCLQVRS